jgi:hypothetical protein
VASLGCLLLLLALGFLLDFVAALLEAVADALG